MSQKWQISDKSNVHMQASLNIAVDSPSNRHVTKIWNDNIATLFLWGEYFLKILSHSDIFFG